MSESITQWPLAKAIEKDLIDNDYSVFVAFITERLKQQLSVENHGDFSRWNEALLHAPKLEQTALDVTQNAVSILSKSTQPEALETCCKQLIPWRKGPFKIADVLIDSEWRSDFKWARIKPHINLVDKRVLDVGCGNGYHCWRMLELQPKWVLGVDPNVLFNVQFRFINHYAQHKKIDVIPLGIEHLPKNMRFFDTVFSMGVLYHRKSPMDHLSELKSLLAKQGELILETLVIEGGETDVFVPKGRYAKMKNVWFLPSVKALTLWLQKVGFKDIKVLDLSVTTVAEQRRTDWMLFESLSDYLDPDNSALTVEGHPAPKRVVLSAK